MSEPVPTIDGREFGRIDASNAPEDFARWMDWQRRRGPDRALGYLSLAPGSRVLDVGCGTGTDVAKLAQDGAHAVGCDRSLTMAKTARDRLDPETASIVVGDGRDLPFPDDCFDACWLRAVLIHAPDARGLLDEVVRVARPGARLVLSEPDHGSHLVTTSELDVFDRVKRHRGYSFTSPMIGRRLPGLALASGMQVDKTWATPIVHRSLAAARAAGGPFDRAVAAAVADGAITQDEADRYESSLERIDADGGFLFVAVAMSVVATVPLEGD